MGKDIINEAAKGRDDQRSSLRPRIKYGVNSSRNPGSPLKIWIQYLRWRLGTGFLR